MHDTTKTQLLSTRSAAGLDTDFCIVRAPEDLNSWPAAYPDDPKIEVAQGGLQQIGH